MATRSDRPRASKRDPASPAPRSRRPPRRDRAAERPPEEGAAPSTCVICGTRLRGDEEVLCHRCLHTVEERARRYRGRPVGGARTPFGTRVAAAITCAECGKRDHIGFRPKAGARVLCRECAAEQLGRYETGVRRRRPTQAITCARCGRVEEVPEHLARLEEPLCRDCLRGIYSHQKGRVRSGERHSSGAILSRRRRRD